MFNFQTKRLATTSTARYQMPEIAVAGQDGIPTLLVVHTGKSNSAFQRALTKAVMADNAPRPKFPTPDQVVERQAALDRIMRALAPGLIVTGWDHVYEEDEGGKPRAVPYSDAACSELFAAPDAPKPGIPDDLFAAMLAYCANADYFRAGLNAEAVAKN